MNLKNLFNFKYGIENLKKSRGVLVFFLGIVPILNTLLFFILSKTSYGIINLETLSIVNMLALCIIPSIVSMTQFNYIYKKKSVDFICSMPISRKTLFITNTIIGIILLIIINLVSSLIFLLLTVCNVLIVPIDMIIDFFLIWSLSYVFVYTVANLSMSIAGNAITQLIIMFILILIIPMLHDYIFNPRSNIVLTGEIPVTVECKNNKCTPSNYECGNNTTCLLNEENNTYVLYANYVQKNTIYPMPYSILKNFSYNTSANLLAKNNIIEMFILIFINFFLGLYLFKKRKMENNETSFKNYSIHLLVKGITLLPLIIFTYVFVGGSEDFLTITLILVIFIAYFFIYELITRKGIYHLTSNIIAFCLTLLFGYGIIFLFDNNNVNYHITSNSIKQVNLSYNDDSIVSSNNSIKITNYNTIQKILKYSLNNYDNFEEMLDVKMILDDNTIISYQCYLSAEDFSSLIEDINKSSDYLNYKTVNSSTIYAFSNDVIDRYFETDEEGKKILSDALFKYSTTTSENTNVYRYISFVSYKDGIETTYTIPTSVAKDLTDYVEKLANKENERLIEDLSNDGWETFGFQVIGHTENVTIPIDYYLSYKAIINFIISQKDKEFNQDEDYVVLSVKTGNDYYNNYTFATNDITSFINLYQSW